MNRHFNSQKHFYAIMISQTVLIQQIQFGISIDFVYTQLNVKAVLFKKNQFNVSTVAMSKTVPFQTIPFSISTLFKCKYTISLSKAFLFQAV